MVTVASQADVIRLDLHRQCWQGIHLWLDARGQKHRPCSGAGYGPHGRGSRDSLIFSQDRLRVTIGQEVKTVVPKESVYVPVETPHRLENPGTEPLVLIEVQTWGYLEEDDIVRLADDFGRVPSK